jgi:hypothetical protein
MHGKVYGQFIDSLSSDDSSESSYNLSVVPSFSLADDSEEPDSGNWYEKLRWWKAAKGLYTVDIRAALDELEVLQEEFETKKTEVLSSLDRYSADLPLKRQAAIHVIDDLLQDLTKRQEELARERTRTQDQKNPDETTTLEEHQKMLNELKKEFEDFNTLYQRLKQVFEVVIPSQIQNAQNYGDEALAAYEGIEQTLDDKKAHQLYNLVENNLENIQATSSYLRSSLWNFIDTAWTASVNLMPKITKSISDLEEKGVVVRPLSAQEKEQMAHLEEERKEKRAQKEAQIKTEKEWQMRPWWQKAYLSVGHTIVRAGSLVWYGVSRPFAWIAGLFSSQVPEKKVESVKAPSTQKSKPSLPAQALPVQLPLMVSGGLEGKASPVSQMPKAPEPAPKKESKGLPRKEIRQEQQKKTLPLDIPKQEQHEEHETEEPVLDDEDAEPEEPEEADEESEEEVPEVDSEEDADGAELEGEKAVQDGQADQNSDTPSKE